MTRAQLAKKVKEAEERAATALRLYDEACARWAAERESLRADKSALIRSLEILTGSRSGK